MLLFHYLPSTSGISWAPGPVVAPYHLALHLFPSSPSSPSITRLSLLIRPHSLTEPAYSRLWSFAHTAPLPLSAPVYSSPALNTCVSFKAQLNPLTMWQLLQFASQNPIISSLKRFWELSSPIPNRCLSPRGRSPLPRKLIPWDLLGSGTCSHLVRQLDVFTGSSVRKSFPN